MDSPHLPRQAVIDSHEDGGFRFAGMSHRGSLFSLPNGIWAWHPRAIAEIDEAALKAVFAGADAMDFFILGYGREPWVAPESWRVRFRAANISCDAMTTGAAVRTYNVMLMEGRRVGAGLIAQ